MKVSARMFVLFVAAILMFVTPASTLSEMTPNEIFRAASPGEGVPPVIYHMGDVALINAMIVHNGLGWTEAAPLDGSAVPADWTGVKWSADTENKRIIELNLRGKSLAGTLNVSGLTELTYLDCSENELSALRLGGLAKLGNLQCALNKLSELDVSGLTALHTFNCEGNNISVLDLFNVAQRCAYSFVQNPITFVKYRNDYTGKVYEVSVNVSPAGDGKVMLTAMTNYENLTFRATPEKGMVFGGWTYRGFAANPSATANPLTCAVPGNAVSITANFMASASPTPDPTPPILEPHEEATPKPTAVPTKPPVKVTGVKTLVALYIVKGKTATLPAAIEPQNATNKSVTWASKNSGIASVNPITGKVKGIKTGKTTVTVTTADGKKSASVAVYVVAKARKLKSMAITPGKATGLTVGETLQVKPKLIPSNATGILPTFASGNERIATIDKAGVIRALKPGKTTITVKAGSLKKSFVLTVGKVASSKIALNKTSLSIRKGRTATLSIKKFTPANTDPQTITWTSGNSKIATVSSKGVVKGIKRGKVTITATTWNGKTAKCAVTVK